MKKIIYSVLFGLLTTTAVQAETPDEAGLRIANEADAYDKGYSDFTSDMTMTLKNRKGDSSVRRIRINTLEQETDGDKSMSIFDEPADVKGTAMLTWSHGLKPDDQWLYLPALKRVKRISSRNKSGPFMGSEFAYEDLGSQEIEKYAYKLVKEESCGEWQCYLIERTPQYEHSGYTRQLVWLDKKHYRMVKTEFYDRKKKLLKTLEITGYQQYKDKYWRADKFSMQNHQNGKSTTLEWTNYVFGTGLKDADFRKNKLKSLR